MTLALAAQTLSPHRACALDAVERYERDAEAHAAAGREDSAADLLESALRLRLSGLGPGHESLLAAAETLTRASNQVASLELRRGQDVAIAEQRLRRTLSILSEVNTGFHKAKLEPCFNLTLNNMSALHLRMGNQEAALLCLREAEALSHGVPFSDAVATQMSLCAQLSKLGRHEEAERSATEAVRLSEADVLDLPSASAAGGAQALEAAVREKVSSLAVAYNNLAVQREYLRRGADCVALYEKAVILAEGHMDRDSPLLARLQESHRKAKGLFSAHDAAVSRVAEQQEFSQHASAECNGRVPRRLPPLLGDHGRPFSAERQAVAVGERGRDRASSASPALPGLSAETLDERRRKQHSRERRVVRPISARSGVSSQPSSAEGRNLPRASELSIPVLSARSLSRELASLLRPDSQHTQGILGKRAMSADVTAEADDRRSLAETCEPFCETLVTVMKEAKKNIATQVTPRETSEPEASGASRAVPATEAWRTSSAEPARRRAWSASNARSRPLAESREAMQSGFAPPDVCDLATSTRSTRQFGTQKVLPEGRQKGSSREHSRESLKDAQPSKGDCHPMLKIPDKNSKLSARRACGDVPRLRASSQACECGQEPEAECPPEHACWPAIAPKLHPGVPPRPLAVDVAPGLSSGAIPRSEGLMANGRCSTNVPPTPPTRRPPRAGVPGTTPSLALPTLGPRVMAKAEANLPIATHTLSHFCDPVVLSQPTLSASVPQCDLVKVTSESSANLLARSSTTDLMSVGMPLPAMTAPTLAVGVVRKITSSPQCLGKSIGVSAATSETGPNSWGLSQRIPDENVDDIQARTKCDANDEEMALILQRLLRGCMERRSFESSRSAAIVLQRSFRRHRTRLRNQAAIRLQSSLRAAMERRHFVGTLHAVVALQGAVRRWLCCVRVRHLRCVVRIQKAWQQYLQRRQQERRREDLASVKALARSCVASLVTRWSMRTLAATKIQCVWHARNFLRAGAATRLQSVIRGACLRRRVEVDGVLIAKAMPIHSEQSAFQCEVRRCATRHGKRSLKAEDWKLIANEESNSGGQHQRLVFRVCHEAAFALAISSTQLAPRSGEVAGNLLRHAEVTLCDGELRLQLRESPKELDSIAPADACDRPEPLGEPSPDKHEAHDILVDPSIVAEASLPWLCAQCGFNNEVSPAVCVLCDAERGAVATLEPYEPHPVKEACGQQPPGLQVARASVVPDVSCLARPHQCN